MKPFSVVIPGQPATKKNSATVVRNHAHILPSAAYRAYERHCRETLAALGRLPHYTLPVRLTCRYYLKDRAHWPDLVGLMQATADIISDERRKIGGRMVTAREWLLSDDRIITSWDGTVIAGIDKARPRVEIVVTPLEVGEALDPYVARQIKQGGGKDGRTKVKSDT